MPLKYIASFFDKEQEGLLWLHVKLFWRWPEDVGGSRIHVHPSFLSKLQVFYRVTAEFTKDFDLKNGPAIVKVIIQRLFTVFRGLATYLRPETF